MKSFKNWLPQHDFSLTARKRHLATMYSLDRELVLGDPGSKYPLLDKHNWHIPEHNRSKIVAEKRGALYAGTNWNADFQAPGVRDKTPYPTYGQKYFRGNLYDVQRPGNVAPVPQYQNPHFKWAQESDWFRNSQLEWQREFYHTRTYTAAASQWVDRGQWNQFPMRFTAIADMAPGSSTQFIS